MISKPVTPDPNRSFILTGEVLRFSDQIWRDPAVTRRNLGQISTDPARFLSDLEGSGHISAKYQRIRSNFGQISTDPAIFRPDIEGSGQISARYRRIRPDLVYGNKLETDLNQPEIDETRTEKSNQISGSVSGQFFIHPPHSSRVQVGHKTDPARPVDTPRSRFRAFRLGPEGGLLDEVPGAQLGRVRATGLGPRVESGYVKTRPELDPLPFLYLANMGCDGVMGQR